MKKLICILAGAALLGACEQKTEVVAPPPATPNPADTGQKRKDMSRIKATNALSAAVTPAVSDKHEPATTESTTETKIESTTTTETAATPNP